MGRKVLRDKRYEPIVPTYLNFYESHIYGQGEVGPDGEMGQKGEKGMGGPSGPKVGSSCSQQLPRVSAHNILYCVDRDSREKLVWKEMEG